MIGESVLGKVVRANALAAVAGADHRLARIGPFAVQLRLLALVDQAAQAAHGPVVILVLAALVLALDFDLVRCPLLVPDADSAFRLVDMLSTRAAGTHA